ncbi:MAG: hypothetical protein LIP23_05870, partial [Planctomycetes bacterium]|nr:hypothetical protein [Planctomycetota bacterium]
MTIILLLAVPLVFALVALAAPAKFDKPRRWLLPIGAAAHALLSARLWSLGGDPVPDVYPWLRTDPLGLLFMSLTSGLFLLVAVYSLGDLERYRARGEAAGSSERFYVGGLFFFLFSMTAVCLAHDLGLLWVAVEATTLATAPLIYFRKNQGSLEATWKYLMICSVGIALALLGTFIMAAAGSDASGGEVTLRIRQLADLGGSMNPALLKASFIFLLVGYGTKMGLAPLHNWLPDAHSEAPSPVSALLSGALLNGAFLAILRSVDIMRSAGLGEFADSLLRLFGLFSMGLSGAFILGQKDFKRLLAYTTVEHMG